MARSFEDAILMKKVRILSMRVRAKPAVFVESIHPFLKVKTDSAMVVRERRIISKDSTPKRGRGCTADDVADLMKRDSWFHLIEVDVKSRWTSVKVEVK